MINKIKSSSPYIVIGVLSALFIAALPLAIKFFFRGFLLLLENPLEALCFLTILTLLVSTWIWLEEKIEKK